MVLAEIQKLLASHNRKYDFLKEKSNSYASDFFDELDIVIVQFPRFSRNSFLEDRSRFGGDG